MTYLVDVRIDARSMYSWAKAIGLLGADEGYIVHSLICAAYGSHRMQPFRIYSDKASGQIRLLGYSVISSSDLTNERTAVAEPLVSAAFVSEVCKEMPSSWRKGATFNFNILVAPVVTISRTRQETDAFLRSPPGSLREDVYAEWLQKRFEGKASISDLTMKSFALQKVSRRGKADEEGHRVLGKHFTIPTAEFEGKLSVVDGDAFNTLFTSAVGKHGAFGFGALLLRPGKP
jgi:CRISPR system Cascade subunit CasE